MLNFNVTSGTLEFTGSGLQDAVLQFKFNRFEFYSTELLWRIEGNEYIAHRGSTTAFRRFDYHQSTS